MPTRESKTKSAEPTQHSPEPTIAVQPGGDDTRTQARAKEIAHDLALPIARGPHTGYDLLLVVTPHRVELRDIRPPAPSPIYVDFIGGAAGYNRRVNRFGLLFQAVGMRRGSAPFVLDATCGLGRDAFLLADNGCVVHAIERSPIVATLLRDGLNRAARDPELHEWLKNRFHLHIGDAREVIKQWPPDQYPDVAYLDPMFPPKTKSALVKKEMRILRALVGDDPDADELFEIARSVARRRVVVKRLRHAPPLAPNPTNVYRQQSIRYDVYIQPTR